MIFLLKRGKERWEGMISIVFDKKNLGDFILFWSVGGVWGCLNVGGKLKNQLRRQSLPP